MEEELGRNALNENNLSSAQRIRDASRLMVTDLATEGLLPATSNTFIEKDYNAECRPADEAEPLIAETDLPPLASLTFPRRTRLGAMMEKIPKPDGYIPKMHFPAWIDWSLSRKLPLVPIDAFVYSRGQLNQPLYRADRHRDYTTVDPLNTWNFLPSSEYNALHDPATHRYFKKPHVQKLLEKQGLITKDAEVVCTQKELNHYREYLEHFQINQLEKALRAEEERLNYQHTLERDLRAYLATNDDYQVRNALARERQKLVIEERLRLLKAKLREDAIRLKRFREERRKALAAKKKAADECAEYMRQQREKLKCERESADTGCRRVQMMEKQARAELMAYITKMRKELVRSLKKSEMMMAKSAAQTRELAKRREVMARLEFDRKRRREEYQQRMEEHRQQFPALTEQRKINHQRILSIMRKFLDLWRAYVKRRKAARADPFHQSTWDVNNTTVQTVHDLHEVAGHEKFDNFILNLIQMKREMAAKEKEDAENLEPPKPEPPKAKTAIEEDEN